MARERSRRSLALTERLRPWGMAIRGAELLVEPPSLLESYRVPDEVTLVDGPPGELFRARERPPLPAFARDYFPDPPDPKHVDVPGTGAWLEWTVVSAGRPRMSPPVEMCLAEFVKLDGAAPDRVLAFARRWGPLGICEHGEPSTHRLLCYPFGVILDAQSHAERAFRGRAWEPVAAWHRYAMRARAVLLAAADLEEGNVVADRTVATLHAMVEDAQTVDVSVAACRRDPNAVRELISWVIYYWLRWGAVGPTFECDYPQRIFKAGLVLNPWHLTPMLTYGFLFGTLAMQLAATLTSPRGIFRCDECREPYTPEKRRPKAGQHHFCASCQDGGNLASKRFSARRRRQVTLHSPPS
jgi:hypothetical protein